jgi:membrane protein DedA with SNARE-associated domain
MGVRELSLAPMSHVTHLLATHGYWIVATVVGIESMGIPAPGETALITAAIYAGTTHRLSIVLLILAAAIGAIVGDNLGYVFGRRFGYGFLLRHGPRFRFDEKGLKLGRFLFERHGGKVVFFGRFIPVLRILAGVLAGAAYMGWRRFLACNAAGGVLWATCYGTAAYAFGDRIERARGPLSILGIVVAALLTGGVWWWLHRHYATLQEQAEQAIPGALTDPTIR